MADTIGRWCASWCWQSFGLCQKSVLVRHIFKNHVQVQQRRQSRGTLARVNPQSWFVPVILVSRVAHSRVLRRPEGFFFFLTPRGLNGPPPYPETSISDTRDPAFKFQTSIHLDARIARIENTNLFKITFAFLGFVFLLLVPFAFSRRQVSFAAKNCLV